MGNYNDHLMEQLADQGDGFYRYVDTYEEARTSTSTSSPACSRRSPTTHAPRCAFDPELVTSYRLVGYENRAMDDHSFADLSADAGELGAGHHATALYEVDWPPASPRVTPIGTAQVLWKTPGTDAPATAGAAPVLAADPEAPLSDSLALATAVADLAELTKGYGGEGQPPGERSTTSRAGAAELADAWRPGRDRAGGARPAAGHPGLTRTGILQTIGGWQPAAPSRTGASTERWTDSKRHLWLIGLVVPSRRAACCSTSTETR